MGRRGREAPSAGAAPVFAAVAVASSSTAAFGEGCSESTALTFHSSRSSRRDRSRPNSSRAMGALAGTALVLAQLRSGTALLVRPLGTAAARTAAPHSRSSSSVSASNSSRSRSLSFISSSSSSTGFTARRGVDSSNWVARSALRSSSSSSSSTATATQPGEATAAAAGDSSSSRPELPSILDKDGQIPTQYDFASVEKKVYAWWEQRDMFKPAPAHPSKQSYVLPMPPPNVTGSLHMGHAMFVALQDILARFHRMRGEPTLYLPGTDHAGIATQMLVERELAKEGLDRKEMGREKFLERTWQWKEEKGGYIIEQMRLLGASADWSRERFTLEPDMSAAVTEAFVRLHDKGLIYKGDYMVNWSPALQTAISDLEVDYTEEEGKLYYFKYPVSGSDESIPVATSRPETILGDTAVCVHPDDPRFSHLVGKTVVVPMSGGREIPVITDTYVDMEFGTGALKITPGHDPNDYEIGKRHSLPTINIMNKDATINAAGGERYAGMDRFECRAKLWEDMEGEGLVVKTEPHTQRVPRSERSGEVIEPLVSSQWFAKMEGMGKAAYKAVEDGDVEIIPKRFEKVWYNWLGDIHDWCISRQLWWGHRIPVWYADGDESTGGEERFFVARNEAEAREKATAAGVKEGAPLRQDEDVLDTWFSSGLWPFASVGWPNEEAQADPLSDLNRFYPASCLETGYDILFFWVARMVMMGIEFTGKSPFKTIYLHGLVRDAKGAKMSKTKGNVIDPIGTIEEFGTDALRYSLVTGVTPGQDIPLSMEKVEANRNFANKLWNAGRYLINNLEGVPPSELESLAVKGPMLASELSSMALPERYIVSKVHRLAAEVTEGLASYNMAEAGSLIYQFLWDEYANWYLEASKTRMADPSGASAQQSRRVLVYVFDTCLRLLHPYMPYITEILWQQLPHEGEALMTAAWPTDGGEDGAEGGAGAEGRDGAVAAEGGLAVDAQAVERFEALQTLVKSLRNARAEYKVVPSKKLANVIIQVGDDALRADLEAEKAVLSLVGRVEEENVSIAPLGAAPPSSDQQRIVHLVVADGLEAYVPLTGMVDLAKERARLAKQADKIRKDADGLEKRLAGKNFVDKAPPALVEKTKNELADLKDQLATIEQSIASMEE